MEGKTLKEKLMLIQTEMKAPKNLYNSFGKYKYRNAEGIYETVKPYLKAHNLSLNMTDDVVEVGGRVYVKSTALLRDCESDEEIKNSAFAREPVDKKGVDDSQITGTASSYARKYALNGLFLLDDTKDPDTDEYAKETTEKKKRAEEEEADQKKTEETGKQLISKAKVNALTSKCTEDNINVKKFCAAYKVSSISEFTEAMHTNALSHWEDVKEAFGN